MTEDALHLQHIDYKPTRYDSAQGGTIVFTGQVVTNPDVQYDTVFVTVIVRDSKGEEVFRKAVPVRIGSDGKGTFHVGWDAKNKPPGDYAPFFSAKGVRTDGTVDQMGAIPHCSGINVEKKPQPPPPPPPPGGEDKKGPPGTGATSQEGGGGSDDSDPKDKCAENPLAPGCVISVPGGWPPDRRGDGPPQPPTTITGTKPPKPRPPTPVPTSPSPQSGMVAVPGGTAPKGPGRGLTSC